LRPQDSVPPFPRRADPAAVEVVAWPSWPCTSAGKSARRTSAPMADPAIVPSRAGRPCHVACGMASRSKASGRVLAMFERAAGTSRGRPGQARSWAGCPCHVRAPTGRAHAHLGSAVNRFESLIRTDRHGSNEERYPRYSAFIRGQAKPSLIPSPVRHLRGHRPFCYSSLFTYHSSLPLECLTLCPRRKGIRRPTGTSTKAWC